MWTNRFKSPYLFYSIEMRDQIKKDMVPDAKVTDIMKKIAEEWRKLSEEEKQEWQDKARKDRERYDSEMSYYRGPLKVPKIRSRKHPVRTSMDKNDSRMFCLPG